MIKQLCTSMVFILALLPSLVIGDDTKTPCFEESWKVTRYESTERGRVVLYHVPVNHRITSTNIACTVSYEVISSANDMPDKAVIGMISENLRRGFLIKWSLSTNIFLTLDIDIKDEEYRGVVLFTVYPDPLARLKNLMTTTKFPTKEQLPPQQQYLFKVNKANVSIMQLKDLVGQED